MNNKEKIISITVSIIVILLYSNYILANVRYVSMIPKWGGGMEFIKNSIYEQITYRIILGSLSLILLLWIWLRKSPYGEKIISIAISIFVIIWYPRYVISDMRNISNLKENAGWDIDNYIKDQINIRIILGSLALMLLLWIWLRKSPIEVYLKFFFTWLFANYIGSMAGVIFLGLGWGNENIYILPLYYSILGLAQYLILYKTVSISNKWISFTIFGAVIGWIFQYLVSIVFDHYSVDFLAITGAVIIGLFVGTAQYFILKPWGKLAAWWVIGNTIGFSTVALINYDCNCAPESIFSILLVIIIIALFYGGIYGFISGFFITPIIAPNLRNPNNDE